MPRANMFAYFQSQMEAVELSILQIFYVTLGHFPVLVGYIQSHMMHLDLSHESDSILMNYTQGYFSLFFYQFTELKIPNLG